ALKTKMGSEEWRQLQTHSKNRPYEGTCHTSRIAEPASAVLWKSRSRSHLGAALSFLSRMCSCVTCHLSSSEPGSYDFEKPRPAQVTTVSEKQEVENSGL
ncbi:mCG5068, partial [Mus musculus]